ncbi:unnamed protein product [Tetraodon nigroviridis]|uniref:(spotted green pufferfish) hypothetical protein n=1 Tax=Tetraodon nigroviridis TaxID=99883 RepID=Q4S1Q5_TETNG|nr:unnamed protein product [Tetraodon nigroviridis]
MTPACHCPLILLTSSPEWSPCFGGCERIDISEKNADKERKPRWLF